MLTGLTYVRDGSVSHVQVQSMPNFHIRARNAHYLTRGAERDYADSQSALTDGIHAATQMVTEDIKRGVQVASVEVAVHDANDEIVERAAVTLAIAPIFVEREPS